MSASTPERRLAAVVIADVVGYTRLMEADESGTFDRLKAVRADLVEPTTAQYKGRVIKSTGDGWLAEFPGVTAAVSSCLEIQRSMTQRNAGLAADLRLDIRIGVNLGEVIPDGDDIYGTGVNVAARLETIAEPGGICISESVYEHVHRVLDLTYEDLGVQPVKNIAEGVRAYAIHAAIPKGPTKTTPDAPAIATGASLAVLPFDNFSGDPSQDYFVDGVVEELLTALARFKSLIVVARASTFAYKGRRVDVRQFADDLGVRYVLEGSVQRSGARVRITGQLIDAMTGYHLWADRFDGEFEDVFDFQDSMTEQVVSALEPRIRRAEIDRARRKRPDSLDAYDLFLRAMPKVYAMRPDENEEARVLLAQALELDPEYPAAAAFGAWCLEQRVTRRWPGATEHDASEAVRLARIALSSDSGDATVVSISGFVLLMIGRKYVAGMAALDEAIDLNPNNPFALMNLGWAHVFSGDLDAARIHLERARPLSRHDPSSYFVLTGLAMMHLLSGRFEDAIDCASAALSVYPDWDATHFALGMALAGAGKIGDASEAIDELTGLMPGASISMYRKILPVRDPERFESLEHLMRLAGLPE